ncbi:MAG TPA: hypothetical protein VJX30_03160 [Terriglobales bacterium]|nr:hypothetical protein [Terriglobales bacterium]
MTYEDAIETVVSSREAQREIERHSCSFAEFQALYGVRADYNGADVLGWLGY